jgi:hypothetical protein
MMLRRARTSAADCAPVSSEWPALFAAAADTSTFALRAAPARSAPATPPVVRPAAV